MMELLTLVKVVTALRNSRGKVIRFIGLRHRIPQTHQHIRRTHMMTHLHLPNRQAGLLQSVEAWALSQGRQIKTATPTDCRNISKSRTLHITTILWMV
jgi:hypothetical protein